MQRLPFLCFLLIVVIWSHVASSSWLSRFSTGRKRVHKLVDIVGRILDDSNNCNAPDNSAEDPVFTKEQCNGTNGTKTDFCDSDGEVIKCPIGCALAKADDDSCDSACYRCNAGYKSDEKKCNNCNSRWGRSSYSTLNQDACTSSCGDGQDHDKDSCGCKQGYYLEVDDFTASCKPCDAGSYGSDNSISTWQNKGGGKEQRCSLCQGKYQDKTGQTECKTCEGNTGPNKESGATGCATCPAGQGGEDGKCSACASGSYSSGTGCKSCPQGNEPNAASGATGCNPCPPNTISKDGKKCNLCPANTYNDKPATNVDTCPVCKANYHSLSGQDCKPCDPGQDREDGKDANAQCVACKDGYFTVGGGAPCATCDYPKGVSPDHKTCDPCSVPGQGSSCVDGKTKCKCASCESGTKNNDTTGVCTQCTAGTSSGPEGNAEKADTLSCYKCQENLYSNTETQFKCVSCKGKTDVPTPNQDGCQKCGAGTYPKRGHCQPCASGTFSPGGTDSCTKCDAWKHAPTQGATACINCDDGKTGDPNRINCTSCPDGEVRKKNDEKGCGKCQPGSQPDMITNGTCSNCGAGHYKDDSMNFCKVCDYGQFQKDAGQSKCNSCPSGFHQDTQGSSSCKPCDYQPKEGQKDCATCSAGSYLQNPATCTPCPPGSFGKIANAHQCTGCSINTKQPDAGKESCIPCEKGSFNTKTNSTDCEKCQVAILNCGECTSGESCLSCDDKTALVGNNIDGKANVNGSPYIGFPKPVNSKYKEIGKGQCASFCGQSFYNPNHWASGSPGQTCQQCEAGCGFCFDKTTCGLCLAGSYLYTDGGFSDDEVNCLLNTIGTQTCYSSFKGKSNGTKCLASCPEGYYKNETLHACMKCDDNCASCTKAGRCDKCSNGLLSIAEDGHKSSCVSSCTEIESNSINFKEKVQDWPNVDNLNGNYFQFIQDGSACVLCNQKIPNCFACGIAPHGPDCGICEHTSSQEYVLVIPDNGTELKGHEPGTCLKTTQCAPFSVVKPEAANQKNRYIFNPLWKGIGDGKSIPQTTGNSPPRQCRSEGWTPSGNSNVVNNPLIWILVGVGFFILILVFLCYAGNYTGCRIPIGWLPERKRFYRE